MEKLKNKEVIAYGCLALCTVGYTVATSYISAFWTDIMGISISVVGIIMLAARLFDGVSDLIMGTIIDNTHTKIGKVKPWFVTGGIGCIIASIALFAMPSSLGMTAKIIYAATFYLLINAVFATMTSVAGPTMLNVLTTDTQDRMRLGSVNFAFMFVGTIIVSFGINFITILGGGQKGWINLCIVANILSVIMLVFGLVNTHERVEGEHQEGENNIKEIAKALFTNKYFFCTFIIYFMTNIYNAILIVAGVYYALHVYHSGSSFTIMTVASYAPCVVTTLLAPVISKKLGMAKTGMISNVIFGVGMLAISIAPRNLVFVVICLVIACAGQGPSCAALAPFCAQAADYGEYTMGVARPGLYSGAASIGTKLGMGLGSALTGIILGMAGYDGMAEVQTVLAENTIMGLYALGPALCAIAIFFAMKPFIKLEKKYPEMLVELEKRRAKN